MERLTRIIKCPDGTNIYDFSNLLTNIVFTLKDTVIKALEENDTEVLRDEIYYYMQECQQEG